MDSADSNALSDWVLVKIGPRIGNGDGSFRLRNGVNSIGRHSSSDIRIDSVLVSRHHAEITIPESKISSLELKDLNSINGTYINKQLCRASTQNLFENNIISFGAEYDEDDASEIPTYVLQFQPLNTFPFPSTKQIDLVPEIVISDDEDTGLDIKPIIPLQTPENKAVSNILTIFGNADETILSGLQRINPTVCEAVKKTSNAELVVLSSDEEESANIEKNPKGIDVTATYVEDREKDSDSQSDESSSEENQLIYSQALINEMKSEMVDENENYESDNKSENENSDQRDVLNRKSLSPPIISLLDDDDEDQDNIGDGDDFDEDFEKKVSNWTNRLFCSQTYPKMECSQTLMSDMTSDWYSSSEDLLIPKYNKETATFSDSSLIQNLFKPLEKKLDSRNTDILPKRKLGDELKNANDLRHSPIVRKKKKRVMRIIDESDESDGYNEDSPRSKDSLECEIKLPKEKPSKTEIQTVPKTTDRRPKVISPPHLKFGRKKITSVSPKSNRFEFLQKKNRKNRDDRLKEIRKERLRKITTNKSNKMDEKDEHTIKKQNKTSTQEHKGTSKVKNTVQNRGSFLCEIGEMSTSVAAKEENTSNVSLALVNVQKGPPSHIRSMNFFQQEHSTLDKCINEVKKVIRKNAEQARNRNAPKKLRFADVEKSYEEQWKIEKKTESLRTKLPINGVRKDGSAINTSTPTNQEDVEVNLLHDIDKLELNNAKKEKKKKTVRFKDEPTIYYFESDIQFSRKVDRKDLMPYLSYRHRRAIIKRSFPYVDKTHHIITLILKYSNEWLAKSFPGVSAVPEQILPIPTTFESFEHYKNVIFPLMKLEYISSLEREIAANSKTKSWNFTLEDVVDNKENIILVTKSTNNNGQQTRWKKIDLVLLQIGELKIKVFAYMVNLTKSRFVGDNGDVKVVLEILPNSIDVEYLRTSKLITIQPAIDNLQVTIGAYNAIYQLEVSPLYEMLLNPTSLLNSFNILKIEFDEEIADEIKPDNLNTEQLNAVKEIYKKVCFNKNDTSPNVSLIQGPPGTGKSAVVVDLALQIVYGLRGKCRDKKILICAQSNCAIDSVAAKLLKTRGRIKDKKSRFTLVRFGIFEKMHSKVHPLSLHNLLEFERVKKLYHTLNPVFCNVNNWKNHLHQLEEEIKTLQLQASANTEMQLKLEEKKGEIRMLRTAYNNALTVEEEHNICKSYLGKCNIVCTTLSSCVKLFQWVDYFDVCIIDEATQCTEPWTFLPLKFGITSLVLVGDSQQLPATVLSKQAAELGLTRPLFTRIENSIMDKSDIMNDKLNESKVIFSLRVQYRMHPEICKFPNSFFYKNKLINAENTLKNTTPLMPYSVFNLDYAQNKSHGQGKIINQLEADFVVQLLKALNEYIPIDNNTYGVITPYAHQRQVLSDAVQNAGLPHVTVNTIDSYQGVEKDVIVISNARTNGVGFLSNAQRLNVAITRPQKCLILCGNFRHLQSVPAWRYLLNDAKQRNVYYEISSLDKIDIKTKIFLEWIHLVFKHSDDKMHQAINQTINRIMRLCAVI